MIDRSFIGYQCPSSRLTIERGRLRFFAKAIGETDPVYTDVDTARAAGFDDLPAPPTFLFSAELASGAVFEVLDTLSIHKDRILHGEQGFIYHRVPVAGETVVVTTTVEDIYEKKGGRLEFVVRVSEVRTDDGELVAELRSVLVVRNPPARS